MEIISIIEVWKHLKWFPKFILKRMFTEERLADLVLIDVLPRHQSVRIDLGEPAVFDIFLKVINMSPYTVELDRAELEFFCKGVKLKTFTLKKVKYTSGQVADLYFSGNIDPAQADQIARHLKMNNDSHLNLHIEFNCSLHDFKKEIYNLNGLNVSVVNEAWRIEQLNK